MKVETSTDLYVEDDAVDSLHVFGESTSIHGIRNLSKRNTLIRRIFWVVVLCGSVTALTWQVSTSVSLYFSYDVTTEYRQSNKNSLEFPNVTICNSNMLRATSLRKDFGGASVFLKDGMWYLKRMFPSVSFITENQNSSWPIDDEFPGGGNVKEFVERNGHSIHTMIRVCNFNGEPCSSNDFVQILTRHGLCFVFSPVVSNQIKDKGLGYGLSLILNVQEAEYYTAPRENVGFRISITGSSDVPDMDSAAMDVATGTETQIKIRKSKMVNLPSPYGQCVEDGTRKLSYLGGPYTQKRCLVECESKFIKAKCSCRSYYIPGGNNGPYCSPKQLECFNVIKRDFDSKRNAVCDCPEECVKEEFVTSISFSSFPSSRIADLLEKDNEKSEIVAAALAEYVQKDAHHTTFMQDNFELRNNSAYLLWSFLKKIRRNVTDVSDVLWQCSPTIECMSDFVRNCQYTLFQFLSEKIYYDYGSSNYNYGLNSSYYFTIQKTLLNYDYTQMKENINICVQLFPGDEYEDELYNTYFKQILVDYLNYEFFGDEYLKIYNAFMESLDYATIKKNKQELVTDYLKKNYARVNIYYDTLKVEEIINKPMYKFFSLVCDFGGLLGLFFGASIVALVETIDFWCMQCLEKRQQKKNVQPDIKG